MRLTCSDAIERHLETLSAGFECIAVDDRLRIVTPYTYPDNALIEVFIEELAEDRVRASDLGETYRHLHTMGFDVTAFLKRCQMAEIIAAGMGVEVIHGQLVKAGSRSELGSLFLDVAAAARGVADLIYTARTYEPATFVEEVGTFMVEHGFKYEPRARLKGQTGKPYVVDFKVVMGPVYVQTLSPRNLAATTYQVNATFRMWSDCNGSLGPQAKISLLNDVDFQWRPHDVGLLERVSRVTCWSKREEQLVGLLRRSLR